MNRLVESNETRGAKSEGRSKPGWSLGGELPQMETRGRMAHCCRGSSLLPASRALNRSGVSMPSNSTLPEARASGVASGCYRACRRLNLRWELVVVRRRRRITEKRPKLPEAADEAFSVIIDSNCFL